MEAWAGTEIDNWIRAEGLVITASDRAARALQSAFSLRRRAEGLSAWPAPAIQSWPAFARAAWEQRSTDRRMLLNPAQEQSIWADIIAREKQLAALLEPPRYRLAKLAIQAHELLCSYAPRFLSDSARIGWDRDAGAFSDWLFMFDQVCRESHLLSPARLPFELIARLQRDSSQRAPLLVVGFDRLLPLQRELFEAWGAWQEAETRESTQVADFFSAVDEQSELNACATWCARELAANPTARLLVITQDIARHRGHIERAFLRNAVHGAKLPFEFSLGVPLTQVPLAHAAHLLLRWLSGSLAENELDWLFSTGISTTGPEEATALQACMLALRRRGLARTEWSLKSFTNQISGSAKPPSAWLLRMREAQQRLAYMRPHPHAPLDWAALVPQLLQAIGLPGVLSSAEFQAWSKWEQALDTCASLGFDGRRVGWSEFLALLDRTLAEALYAAESRNAPIQIAGPAESAGLNADAIWFLGADEDAWPGSGSMHPLLPPHVQRDSGMPHAAAHLDWDLAQSITTRLLASAPVVHFSYARQKGDSETRPSRLVAQIAGSPHALLAELAPSPHRPPLTISFEDASMVPFPPNQVRGGSGVLTSQSQCPFKAFAIARLGARSWEPAEFGLTASQRGQLLHAVLHAVWAGPPDGLRSLHDLLGLADRRAFVDSHVERVLQDQIPPGVRERMPHHYLQLEAKRLARLVGDWLAYEAARLPFSVENTEVPGSVSIAGLSLGLRLDRIDRLNDDTLLVIDYKSGDVSPKAWALPRPDDVQLPLYAGFALGDNDQLGGLVFAKVRAGDCEFAGHLGNATATLSAQLKRTSPLVKNALTAEQLIDWRETIEQLARDFLAGRAEVDPRESPATCERCDLQALCRIHENQAKLEENSEIDEAAHE